MIRLYIGGYGHGQAELAEKETRLKPAECTPDEALKSPAIDNFHLITKQVLAAGGSPQEYAKKLIAENPDAVICSDEIGCGIHPLAQEERIWREETGRALCILAEGAGTVTRVYYGIGQRIKG
ncbi:MAG: bifunctional adenosylcobinamide kinase/adenosylcobinamide-phosphate guanylyltransferase [Spirochaetales bacterium]|nr:bifunctional adenosylcobinamide kinase/adenosylcobinamide-phosphate guanylyltransferase [Spirochaetales bacterium]